MPPVKRQPEEPETATDVVKDRQTPEAAEDSPFTVQDFRDRGDVLLGAYTLPDIRAAFAQLPKTRPVSVADARQKVKAWLAAPMHVEPPIETPVPTEPLVERSKETD